MYVGRKDMMGVLLLYVFPFIHRSSLTSRSLKGVKGDEVIAPDGMRIDASKPVHLC